MAKWNIRNPDAPDYVTLCIICFTPCSEPSGINQYLSRSTRDSCTVHLKCDGTRTETRFLLSVKRTSPFNRREGQFSRLLAAEMYASAV